MSSVLAALWRRPEHPCGCPGPCSEPSRAGARTRCSPLHFPAHPKEEWRGLPGGRFEPDRHRPALLVERDADLVRLRRPEQPRHSAQGYCLISWHPNRLPSRRPTCTLCSVQACLLSWGRFSRPKSTRWAAWT